MLFTNPGVTSKANIRAKEVAAVAAPAAAFLFAKVS